MCGRYSVGKSPPELAGELGASLATDDAQPRFHVAPTQQAPMLVAVPERRLGLARFGWKVPRMGRIVLNARAETALEKALFRPALARRRALVPADGFYEWKGVKGAPKQAFFLHQEGRLLTFAGLYAVEPVEGGKQASFVLLTTSPTPAVAAVHDRMPLVVPEALRSAWMDPTVTVDGLLRELVAGRPDFSVRPVSSRVGSVSADDPTLRDPG